MMSSDNLLTPEQAREIQEQLFATYRQQTSRHVPVHLPRKDFWEMVKRLLTTLDLQIHGMIRKHGADLRVQNEQKRQANVRHIASELARRRMVAMMTHASSQSLRMATNASDVATPLPPIDWQKADPAERALYNAIEKEMDKFKMTIGWREMQDGLRGEMEFVEPTHKPGTMQLDDFTEEALTDRAHLHWCLKMRSQNQWIRSMLMRKIALQPLNGMRTKRHKTHLNINQKSHQCLFQRHLHPRKKVDTVLLWNSRLQRHLPLPMIG